MVTVHPYLNFAGTCREAFTFYADLFGGQVEMQTFGDSPMADAVEPSLKDRIINARLTSDNVVFMGSDAPSDRYEKPQGFMVTVDVDDVPTAERFFERLSDGGSVVMPIQETYWSERFGMCVDRFDIPWMVNATKPVAAAT